jgi:hypothetical protein
LQLLPLWCLCGAQSCPVLCVNTPTYRPLISVVYVFREITLTKYILKIINIYGTELV